MYVVIEDVFVVLNLRIYKVMKLSALIKHDIRLIPVLKVIRISIFRRFERILYIWAYRNPGSGYVQGINDLVTPFYVVFLDRYVGKYATLCQCNGSYLN